MATATKTPVELSILEQIEQTAEEIKRRRLEVKDLDAEAAQLIASDADRSVELDLKARALERLIARLVLTFNDQVKTRHQEQYQAHVALIENLVAKKTREAEALAEALRKAGVEAYEAIQRLAKIGHGDLSGDNLLRKYPRGSFEEEIRGLLGFRVSSLGRAGWDLQQHAGNVNYFPPQGGI